jgi:pimeloyl-ACP methyl ester carboxylesterase
MRRSIPVVAVALACLVTGARGNDGQAAMHSQTREDDAADAKVSYPAEPRAAHSTIAVNNIQIHIAEMGDGPLVLFLHGFPELWYSWRHQLPVIAANGYHAVAMDMRGFGGTDRPLAREAYSIRELCGDLTGVMDHFGADDAVVVGHDWGAAVTFYCAQLVPERFRGMVTMSVPYGGPRSATPPLQRLQERYGDNFFYMLYFQTEAAEAELASRTRELFEKILADPGVTREDPAVTSTLASDGGWLDRIGYPKRRPDWLPADALDYYVAVFTQSGFSGGLNYYRNLDENWRILRETVTHTMNAPAIFIGGQRDFLLGQQTAGELEDAMRTITPNIKAYVLPDTGHWLQNEKPAEVNKILIGYLSKLDP